MTVAATTNRKTYTGDNVTTSFATSPVIFYLSSNLQVRTTIIATGVSTLLTENTHYTVSGGSSAGATGTVNLAGGSSPHGALLSTEKLVILRVLPLTQASDFVNNNNSDAEVLETALDKLTDVDQQLSERQDRALTFAEGDVSGSTTTLQDASVRASRVLGFDALGVLTTLAVTAGTSLIDFASSIGSTLIGWIQVGTGAILRTLQSKLRDTLHISDFGGSSGASAAVNTTALQNAIAQAVALGKAGVEIGPGGTWALTAGTNWINRDIAIVGRGKPTLDFSAGTGVGFKLDAGGAGVNVRGMTVENFIIKGGPSITDIFYSRGCVASQFRNLEAREGTATGFALKFAVLNTYQDLRVSNDSLAMTTTPAISFSLDTDGTAGNRCQANVFIDCDASGKGALSVATGFKLIDATLNTFEGGTAESLLRGIDIAAACRLNLFEGMDLEHNVNEDIADAGTGTIYNGVSSAGGGAAAGVQLTGHGATFEGGAYAVVSLGAASTDSSFYGVGFASAAGLTGTGTYKRYGCYTVDGAGLRNGTLADVIGQFVSSIGVAGLPNIKGVSNIVPITGVATPLFSAQFSGMWIARDSTSAGIAFGTCDPGVPEITVLSNTIPATVVFSMVAGIVNARTTAGTANRNINAFAIATTGG